MATTKEVAILIRATDRATKTLRRLDKVGTRAFKNMGIAAAGIGVAMGVVGVAYGALIKGGIKYNAVLENYTSILTTVFKSQEKANEAMQDAITFAARTPFEIPEIAETTAMLETFGLSAQKWLPKLGDMAAATGKGILQAAEALIKAQVGQFRRLQEFGITKELLIPQGLEVDAQGAVKNIESVGTALFNFTKKWEGQMDIMSEGFRAMTSNLADLWGGILGVLARPAFEQVKVELRSTLDWANRLKNEGRLEEIIGGWAEAGRQAIIVIEDLVKTVGPDLLAAISSSGDAVNDFIVGLDVDRIKEVASQIMEFTKAIVGATVKVIAFTLKNWKLIAAFAGFVILTKVAIWMTTVTRGILLLVAKLPLLVTKIQSVIAVIGVAGGIGLVAALAALAAAYILAKKSQREYMDSLEKMRKAASGFTFEDILQGHPKAVAALASLDRNISSLRRQIKELNSEVLLGQAVTKGMPKGLLGGIETESEKRLKKLREELEKFDEQRQKITSFREPLGPEIPKLPEPIDIESLIKPFEVANAKVSKMGIKLTQELEKLTLRRVDFELNEIQRWVDAQTAGAKGSAAEQQNTLSNALKGRLMQIRGDAAAQEATRKQFRAAEIAIEQNKLDTIARIEKVAQLKSEKIILDDLKERREAAKDATDIAKQAANDEFIARAQLHIDLLRLKGEEAKANEAQARLNANILAREMNDGIAAGNLLQAELQAIRQTETDQKQEAARADEAILRAIELKTLESQGRMREAALIRLAEETKAMERAGSSRLALFAHHEAGIIEIDKQGALARLDQDIAAMKQFGVSSERMAAIRATRKNAIEKAAALENLNLQMTLERQMGTNDIAIAQMTAEGRAAIEQRFALQSAAGRMGIVRQAQEQIRQSEFKLQEQLDSRRQDAFDRETDRILQLERTYSNYIDGALTLVDTLMSAQEQGWTRTLAALIQFTTRAIADFIRLRGMEKLKRAEEKKTAAAFHKAHGAKMLAHAAEAAFLSAMAFIQLDFVRGTAFAAAGKMALASAGISAAEAIALETSALKDQTAASKDLIAATVVEGAGQAVAMGLRAQADAADRQKQAAEDRMRAEERLQQEILNAQGREGEARLVNLQRQVDEYNKLGVDQDLLRRWEAVQEAEAAGMPAAVPESIPVLPPPPIRVEPPGSIPVESPPPIVIRTPAIIPVEQHELIAIEEPDLAPRRIIVEPIPPIIVAAPAFIPVRQPEPIGVIVPESIPVDVPVIAIVPPEPIEVIAPESIPIEEPPSIVVEIPAIIVEPPEPIVVILPDAIPVMMHPPIPVVQSEPIPIIEPEPVSVIVPEPIGVLPPEPIHVLLPAIVVDIPASIPVVPVEPIFVLAPESIPVEGLPPIVVEMPVSVPVEPSEPLTVIPPESIPVLSHPPIAVETPAFIPVIQAEPVAIIPPEPIQVLIPESISIEPIPPVIVRASILVTIEQPEPITVILPQSIAVVIPSAIVVEVPEPIAVEQPRPVSVIQPEPIEVSVPEFIAVEELQPVVIEAPAFIPVAHVDPLAVMPSEPIPVLSPPPIPVITPEPLSVVRPDPVAIEQPPIIMVRVPASIPIEHIEPVAVIAPEPIVVLMPDFIVVEQVEPIPVASAPGIPVQIPEPIPIASPEAISVDIPTIDLGADIVARDFEAIVIKVQGILSSQLAQVADLQRRIDEGRAAGIEVRLVELQLEQDISRVIEIATNKIVQAIESLSERVIAPVAVDMPEPIPVERIEPIQVLSPDPVTILVPESIPIQAIEPIVVEVPESIPVEQHEAVKLIPPEPISITVPEMIPVQAIEPVIIGTPEPIPVKRPEPIEVMSPPPIRVLLPEPIAVQDIDPVIVQLPAAIPVDRPEPISIVQPEPIMITVHETIPIAGLNELDRIMTAFMKSLAEVQSIISIDDIMMQGREIQAQQELQSRIDQNRVIGIETGLVEHLQRMTTAIQANTAAVLAGGDRGSGATIYQTIYFQGVDFSSDEMVKEWAEAVTPFIEEVEGKALDTDG